MHEISHTVAVFHVSFYNIQSTGTFRYSFSVCLQATFNNTQNLKYSNELICHLLKKCITKNGGQSNTESVKERHSDNRKMRQQYKACANYFTVDAVAADNSVYYSVNWQKLKLRGFTKEY